MILSKLRNSYLSLFMIVVLFIPIIQSCTRDEPVSPRQINLEGKILEFHRLQDIIIEISLLEQENLTGTRSSSKDYELKLKEVMQPLVENGRGILNELIRQIDLKDPQYKLTKQEIKDIENISESDLAQLSFIYSILRLKKKVKTITTKSSQDTDIIECNMTAECPPKRICALGKCVGWEEVGGCIASSFGIPAAVKKMIANTAVLATAEGLLTILKLLVKRYAGWIGLGWAIYEFTECLEVWD